MCVCMCVSVGDHLRSWLHSDLIVCFSHAVLYEGETSRTIEGERERESERERERERERDSEGQRERAGDDQRESS